MFHSLPTNGTAVSLPADQPYTILPGSLASGILLLCDHADNNFPAGYDTLGLPASQLKRHIAYDPGVAGIARHMAELLDAPAILTRYSRLLIDPNRGEDDPTLIMRLSDGAVVPGNAHLSREERQKRIDQFYRPYHQTIADTIDAMMATGKPPVIFSIHSFTENWRGWMRPWHAGVPPGRSTTNVARTSRESVSLRASRPVRVENSRPKSCRLSSYATSALAAASSPPATITKRSNTSRSPGPTVRSGMPKRETSFRTKPERLAASQGPQPNTVPPDVGGMVERNGISTVVAACSASRVSS
jgi:predicted N-formylglutamate amidohydrolase